MGTTPRPSNLLPATSRHDGYFPKEDKAAHDLIYPWYQVNSNRGFITKWTVAGDAAARTITLPLINARTEGSLAYDCWIDWGDGTALSHVLTYNSAARAHAYAADGTYNVEIKGTCEGWSFANAGDKLKIVEVVYWGDPGIHNGWKYLSGAFYGCTNLRSLGVGSILASGTGVLTDGFYTFATSCPIREIPVGLFWLHPNLTTGTNGAFDSAFAACTLLSQVPVGTFKAQTLVTNSAFKSTFNACTALGDPPADLYRYNTLVGQDGFYHTYYGAGCVTIPGDLHKYNTVTGPGGHNAEFATMPNLATVGDGLLAHSTVLGAFCFYQCFAACPKLAINPLTFYAAGGEATRFAGKTVGLESCFSRTTWAGAQGTAPALWNCTFGTVVSTTCFAGTGNTVSSISNYNDITAGWK